MATASVRSLRNALDPVVGASRDDLVVGDVVTVESVNVGTAYAWSIAYKPPGSAAVFSSTGTETAITQNPGTFTVDVDGPYLLRLQFTDAVDGTTEQFVRLRAVTAFGGLKLVAAGERYDTLRVPVDATLDGWADEQNTNLTTLLALIQSPTASTRTLYVDPEQGDFQTIQAAMDFANAQAPTVSSQWVVLTRLGTYVEDLTFYPYVNLFAWPPNEGTPQVRVQNATPASHTMALAGAGETVTVCGVYFEQPAVSANPCVLQTGQGVARWVRCRIEAQGNTGEAYETQATGSGRTEFIETHLLQNGVLPTDYALRVTSGRVSLDRSRVVSNFGSGIYIGTGATSADLRYSSVTVSPGQVGSLGVTSFGESLEITHSRVNNDTGASLALNPGGTGTPGDLFAIVSWCDLGHITADDTNVGGVFGFFLGSAYYGTLGLSGTATVDAYVYADTLSYDNGATGITAENVQDAIDEVYAFASAVRTLDDAYDGGVAASGSGRRIIADQGPVQIVDGPVPSDPIPAGNTSGGQDLVGRLRIGAIDKPEIQLDPNPFGNGPEIRLGREIWANDAPFGSTALLYADAGVDPTYHNYNLRLGTKGADGGTRVGSLFFRAGDSYTTIDAGSVFVEAGSGLDGGGGDAGDVFLVPGDSASGSPGSVVLVRPDTATAASLQAVNPFAGSMSTAGWATFGTDQGSFTVTFVGGENLAAVQALFDAENVVTSSTGGGGELILTTTSKGPRSEVFLIAVSDPAINTDLGDFTLAGGATFTPGTWSDTMTVSITGTNEITFGAGDPNPMVYNTATGKLTIPGLIDPTGIIFDEAGVPATGPNKGGIFVSDGSGGLTLNDLYYADAAGVTTSLTSGGGGGPTPPTIVEPTTASYNVTVNDDYVLSNRTGTGAVTINLPAGATHTTKVVTIKDKKGDAGGSSPITINPNGLETIDGNPDLTLNNGFASVTLVFNGTDWSTT